MVIWGRRVGGRGRAGAAVGAGVGPGGAEGGAEVGRALPAAMPAPSHQSEIDGEGLPLKES